MIVYISIGNSDDKLTQKGWSDFIADVDAAIGQLVQIDDVAELHGRWFSAPDVEWQSACWCVELDVGSPFALSRVAGLKLDLIQHARTYGQDSIAWAEVKETELLG